MGIEPTRPAWKAGVLPLNYIRIYRGDTKPNLPDVLSTAILLHYRFTIDLKGFLCTSYDSFRARLQLVGMTGLKPATT